jgi:hypothetical protein
MGLPDGRGVWRKSIGDNPIAGVHDGRKWHAACSINHGARVRRAVNLLFDVG